MLIGTAIGGIPVSTTHTITGSIVGVGATQRLSAVRWGVAGSIVWAWILTIPLSGLIAALVHFSPAPLISFGPDKAQLYSALLMVLVGFLSVMMVSTWRFSSFKTVGTNARSMRTIILALSVGMLIFLYSQYVLLAIVIAYILHGLISRLASIFWRRSDSAEAKIEPNPRSSHN